MLFYNGNLRSVKAFSSDIPALFFPSRVDPGELVTLDTDESRHARALRLRPGDTVQLLDGAGGRAFGTLLQGDRGGFPVRIRESVLEEEDPGAYIGLAVGLLSDKNRMEWLIEKSVELGVREIQPLQSERAEGFFKKDRAGRVAIAALKQSQRTRLPCIGDPVGWDGLAGVAARYDWVLLCHEGADPDSDPATILEPVGERDRVLIVVGPEGGFSEEEVDRAGKEFDARIVSLGPTRLRAETAAIAVLVHTQCVLNAKFKRKN